MKIGSPAWKEMIVDGARGLGVVVHPAQADQFAAHALILKEWKQKINLTAIDSPLDVAVKHFLDSIISSRYVEPGSRVLDVGSGAGFPGIPLKIMIPSLNVILVEATRKKVSFLKHVIRQLKLSDTKAIHSRLEDLPKQGIGEFDVIVCRAFSSLADFAEKSLPHLAPDGLLIAFKGRDLTADLSPASTTRNAGKACLVLGKDPHRMLQMEFVSLKLPFLNLSRTLILLRRKRAMSNEIDLKGNM